MPPLVKICGLMTPDAVDAAVLAGADMVGFVFFAPSPRHIEADVAARLMARVPDGVCKVALTVDADDRLIGEIVDHTTVDLLQLHGSESPARLSDLKSRFGLPVMKVLPVSHADDLATAGSYGSVADKLMFDARPPKGANRPGGNAQIFDWRLLHGFTTPLPWLLAGGLTAENVAEAVAISGATAVDVSSGVESRPGHKDTAKIHAFVRAVKAIR